MRSPLLVLAPHPDDEVVGCGGLLAALSGTNVAVTIAWMTSGERGVGGFPEDLGPTREKEALEAARRLGITHARFLQAPDGALATSPGLVERLAELLVETDARTILLPHPWDAHPDHRATARALVGAAARAPRDALGPIEILAYGVETFLSPYWTNLTVDVSEGVGRRRAAAAAHVTQATIDSAYFSRFEWVALQLGRCYGVRAAECYWRTDIMGLGAECDAASGSRAQAAIGSWGGYRHLPRHLMRSRRVALRVGRAPSNGAQPPGNSADCRR